MVASLPINDVFPSGGLTSQGTATPEPTVAVTQKLLGTGGGWSGESGTSVSDLHGLPCHGICSGRLADED